MSYTDNLADELFFDLQVELSNDEEGGSFSESLLKHLYKQPQPKKSKVQLERFETKEDIHLDIRTE